VATAMVLNLRMLSFIAVCSLVQHACVRGHPL
jgi:hypothetical protein